MSFPFYLLPNLFTLYLCGMVFTITAALPPDGFDCRYRAGNVLDTAPQTSAPPYALHVLNAVTGRPVRSYELGGNYVVLLYGERLPFSGLHLYAHRANQLGQPVEKQGRFVQPVGLFTPDLDTWRQLGIEICTGSDDKVVTHANMDKKYVVKMQWQAPIEEDSGPIQFVALIAQSNETYWTDWRPTTALLLPASSPQAGANSALKTKVDEKEVVEEEIVPATFGPIKTTVAAIETTTEPAPTTKADLKTEAPKILDLKIADEVGQEFAKIQQQLNSLGKNLDYEETGNDENPTEEEQAPAVSNVDETAPWLIPPEDRINEELQRIRDLEEKLRKNQFTTTTTAPVMVTTRDPCSRHACYNGGTCERLDDRTPVAVGLSRAFCRCQKGWTGVHCDEPDHCASNPCNEHSDCVNKPDGHQCSCHFGWAGDKCDRFCPSYFCQNGGVCTVDKWDRYICKCVEGFEGERCQRNTDDCKAQPCKNGGTCLDRVGDFHCLCDNGWTGKTCEHPCQDIYPACTLWARQGQCEQMRAATTFFDDNCPRACGMCTYSNATAVSEVKNKLPPVLEPFSWLIGEWHMARSFNTQRFPVDFDKADCDYYQETMRIKLADTAFFGTPALSYETIARAVPRAEPEPEQDGDNLGRPLAAQRRPAVKLTSGFISLKSAGRQLIATLVSTTRHGLTTIEEGPVSDNKIEFMAVYVGGPNALTEAVPLSTKRIFVLEPGAVFMAERLRKIHVGDVEESAVKYFRRVQN